MRVKLQTGSERQRDSHTHLTDKLLASTLLCFTLSSNSLQVLMVDRIGQWGDTVASATYTPCLYKCSWTVEATILGHRAVFPVVLPLHANDSDSRPFFCLSKKILLINPRTFIFLFQKLSTHLKSMSPPQMLQQKPTDGSQSFPQYGQDMIAGTLCPTVHLYSPCKAQSVCMSQSVSTQ